MYTGEVHAFWEVGEIGNAGTQCIISPSCARSTVWIILSKLVYNFSNNPTCVIPFSLTECGEMSPNQTVQTL